MNLNTASSAMLTRVNMFFFTTLTSLRSEYPLGLSHFRSKAKKKRQEGFFPICEASDHDVWPRLRTSLIHLSFDAEVIGSRCLWETLTSWHLISCHWMLLEVFILIIIMYKSIYHENSHIVEYFYLGDAEHPTLSISFVLNSMSSMFIEVQHS